MKINYNILNEKLNKYSELTIADKYLFADRIFKLLQIVEPEKIKDILKKNPFHQIYTQAQMHVSKEVSHNGLKISCHNRQMFFIYDDDDDKKSFVMDFFEICDFTEKMSTDLLEKVILLGFFMNQERMTIIQSYEGLTRQISSFK